MTDMTIAEVLARITVGDVVTIAVLVLAVRLLPLLCVIAWENRHHVSSGWGRFFRGTER